MIACHIFSVAQAKYLRGQLNRSKILKQCTISQKCRKQCVVFLYSRFIASKLNRRNALTVTNWIYTYTGHQVTLIILLLTALETKRFILVLCIGSASTLKPDSENIHTKIHCTLSTTWIFVNMKNSFYQTWLWEPNTDLLHKLKWKDRDKNIDSVCLW